MPLRQGRPRPTASGVDGRFTDLAETPHKLSEFAYIDPDGDLLRVGSEMT